MKSKTFKTELADIKLLPEDFDKTNPDNMILSVALKYRNHNPFLITNDINFQNRAASMGIPLRDWQTFFLKMYISQSTSRNLRRKRNLSKRRFRVVALAMKKQQCLRLCLN